MILSLLILSSFRRIVGEHLANVSMTAIRRADLEATLRTRHLDRTLTSAVADHEPLDPSAFAPTGMAALDALLGGGLRRGHVSELVGSLTSGRTTLALEMIAAATRRGELVALVDALDRLDVLSAASAAGLDLERLLWIRGHLTSHLGVHRAANLRAMEQAIKALSLVLQSGVCDLVIFDIADAPLAAIRALPFTTWLRLHRMIEGRRTACLLVSPAPIWRSPAGVTLEMTAEAWTDERPQAPSHTRVFTGLTMTPRIIRAHVPTHASLCVSVSATCA
jgi:hypothetical protein